MSADADATTEPAPYLQITPADGELGNIESVFRQLAAENQRLAVYLVSPDDTVQYILGAPGGDLGFLQRFCRRLLPDTYSLEPTTNPLHEIELTDESATTDILGSPRRRRDWMLPLTPHHATTPDDTGVHSFPGDIVDHFADLEATCIYQAIIEPDTPYEYQVKNRKTDLEIHDDTPGQTLASMLFGSPDIDDPQMTPSNAERHDALDDKDARYPLAVTARILATGPNADRVLDGLDGLLAPLSTDYYTIRTPMDSTTDPDAVAATYEAMQTETTQETPRLRKLKRRIPLASNASPRIITDATTAPHFCLLGPGSLTQPASRATAHHRQEQTGRPRPDPDTLDHYQTEALTLGLPQTLDTTPDDDPIALPPNLQPLHIALFGRTGSGKSTTLLRAMLDNHEATEGADIFIDEKGDGMPLELLQAHYHRHGTLQNVYYLDCQQHLPALSVFDIRDDIEAGIDRTTAVVDTVDHYVDILEQLIGEDQYQDAIRSTDLVRYLLRACFDPVHGQDAFSHQHFLETITRMQTTQEAPAVSDEDLSTALQGVTATHRDSFMKVMHGVKTRVEEIVTDQRLTQIFNHTPTGDDPHFRFDELLDEDALIILDTGGLRDRSQRVLTLVLLSELWASLRRRKRTHDDPPLVNLYIEEAAQIAASETLRDLLAQGRGFNVSLTLATQYPAQLRDNQGTLEEVLNNVSTIVTGNVPDDQALARRFATSDHDPADIASRLRALSRGEWLATLPAPFMEDVPHPFQLQSTPIPTGHPESTQPLSKRELDEFQADLEAHQTQLTKELALDFTTPDTPSDTTSDDEEDQPTEIVATTLPHTQRFPSCIEYDPHRHATRCTSCDNHYAPSINGLKRAIQCCHTLTDVDRDDIPTVAINLKLSPDEIQASQYSPKQLGFLQVVHTAQHQRYTDLEYDLTRDSMVRLREYVGIDQDAIDALLADDCLRKDTEYPHTLYTVTADGRNTINEATREGVDHGDGHGDLGETSQHRMAVQLGQEYLDQEYVDDPDHPATRTAAYYPTDDGTRLDAAALDDNDDVVIALEAERINHDVKEAVPADYDKMAGCDPAEAIWVTMNRDGGHTVLQALNNPNDGTPRVEKTYSPTTPPRQYNLTQPGCTQILTLSTIRNRLP